MSQDFRLYDSADVWNQAMQLGQRNLLHAIIDFWPNEVENALDVGCGDGKLTRVLAAEKQLSIVGFDSSAEALSRLQLPTVQGDAVDMPFDDASFDLVLSTDVLEHVPDESHGQVWSEIFRVARRHVMVAVPFREELLDATAECQQCGQTYHVNWHERSYDFEDLSQRSPDGWQVKAFVVAGEAWSDLLPMETHFRRMKLGQWSGWQMGVCPHCGASGQDPLPYQPLPKLAAAALGKRIYAALEHQRVWRSHSEVLCIYTKDIVHAPVDLPQATDSVESTCLAKPGAQRVHSLLVPYPQVARCVQAADAGLIIQFPVYADTQTLHVHRAPGSTERVDASIEDGLGLLFSGCILEPDQPEATIHLTRQPIPGLYGVLLRTQAADAVTAISLGSGPAITRLAPPEHGQLAYYLAHGAGSVPTWVQVTKPMWLDPTFWDPQVKTEGVGVAGLLTDIERLAEEMQTPWQAQLQQVQHELESGRVEVQNLRAECDALTARAGEAERLAVEVQNLRAERDALAGRAGEADRLAVESQNLRAECDVLMARADEADQLAVAIQNLQAERDALARRAGEADQLITEVQNLRVARDVLTERLSEVDRLLVTVQNLQAERDGLVGRAGEADRLAVEVQNLQAERDALLVRAREADRLAVNTQNLQAERDALMVRAREADQLAVDVQNLQAERDALMARAREADKLAVDVQNLLAINEQLIRQDDAVDAKPHSS